MKMLNAIRAKMLNAPAPAMTGAYLLTRFNQPAKNTFALSLGVIIVPKNAFISGAMPAV
jgi:hypothetical protein